MSNTSNKLKHTNIVMKSVYMQLLLTGAQPFTDIVTK